MGRDAVSLLGLTVSPVGREEEVHEEQEGGEGKEEDRLMRDNDCQKKQNKTRQTTLKDDKLKGSARTGASLTV